MMFSAVLRRLFRPSFALVVSCCAVLAATPAQSQTASQSPLQAMKLVSGQSGWLLAGNRLFWTNSLGAQWAEITPAATGATLHGVSFNAAGHGWAAETRADGSFAVAATVDRGAHWTTSTVPSPFADGIEFGGTASPAFTDDAHGWLMLSMQSSSNFSRGILMQTTDGGAHWAQLPTPPVGGDITFADALHGFAGPGVRGDDLYATSDGGQTWQPLSLPTATASLAKASSKVSLPSFTDATHASLLRSFDTGTGTAYVRYATSDAGKTWQAAAPTQSSTPALVTLAATGVATSPIASAPSRGLLQKSVAGLNKLSPVQATFSTPSQGWVLLSGGACSGTDCTQTSTLLGTLDGGKTFFQLGKLPGLSLEATHTSTRGTGGRSELLSPMTPGPNANFPGIAGNPLVMQMGFDKCEIQTTSQMQDWYTNSPYRAVGAYIGGISRACTNVGFTQSWAGTVLAQGWGIIAIWVGPQAPNSTLAHKLSGVPATDQATGTTEADAAVAAAAGLGFGAGSVIYYDMEAYTRTTASEASTQAFLEGWTKELHTLGYLSAVYSSHPEIQDWEQGKIADAPDDIWFAYFFSTGVACGTRCQNTTSTDIPDNFWPNHQRLRQTSSSFTSTYGSTAASIDEDWTDGAVISITTPQRLTVSLTGGGFGAVASADTYITCGTVCSANYAPSTKVTLTATAAALSSFSKWTGCDSVSGNTCTVTPAAASSVVADFEVTPPVFTATSSTPALLWDLTQSATATLTVNSGAPYKGVYTFACTGLPSYIGCVFSPSTVTADGSGAALTSKLSLVVSSAANHNPFTEHLPGIQFAWLLGLLAPLAFSKRRRAFTRSRMLLLVVALAGLAGTQALMGCSDSRPVVKTIYSGDFSVVVTSGGATQQIPMHVVLNE